MQQDNAMPHTARTTVTKIQELVELELLPHPALILRLQITICFDPWPYFSWNKFRKHLRCESGSRQKPEIGTVAEQYNLIEKWLKNLMVSTLKSSLIFCQNTFQITFCLKTKVSVVSLTPCFFLRIYSRTPLISVPLSR